MKKIAKHTKPFFKINFEDLEIAENFFENEKHFSEFLLAVSYYYRGVDYTIKQKIVQRYFNTYKKTMDFIIESKKTGSEGGKQRVENQKIKENTLEGVLEPPLEPPLEPNNKELSINNKELSINNKEGKEIKDTPSAFSFYYELLKLGAEKQLVSDWLAVRRKKKLTNTETALKGFLKQVDKSGYSLNDVLTKCIEKSWGGFEADWYKKEKRTEEKIRMF